MDECDLCGCTDLEACPGGCSWVAPGICSAHDEMEIHAALALRGDDELLDALERDVLAPAPYVDALAADHGRRLAQRGAPARRIA